MTDITQNITAPDRYLLRTTRRIGMLSYKSARVRFDHRTTVQGVSFPSTFRLTEEELTRTFSQFYLSDGNQSLSISGKVEAEFPDTITTGSPPWAEVLISIKAVDRYWNRVTGEWEVGFYANRFGMTDTEGAVGEETDIKFEANINLETGLIPDLPGDELEIIFYVARSTNTDPIVISNFSDFINFQLTINNPAVAEGQNTAIDYQLTQQSAARGRYDDGSIWFGDGPTAYARSAITRDEEGDELTSEWRFSYEAASIVHANILLREVMDMKRTQVRGLTADLLGEYKPCKMPNIDDFFHFFIGGNQNGKDNKWAANLFRLNRVTELGILPEPKEIFASQDGGGTVGSASYFYDGDFEGLSNSLYITGTNAFSTGIHWNNRGESVAMGHYASRGGYKLVKVTPGQQDVAPVRDGDKWSFYAPEIDDEKIYYIHNNHIIARRITSHEIVWTRKVDTPDSTSNASHWSPRMHLHRSGYLWLMNGRGSSNAENNKWFKINTVDGGLIQAIPQAAGFRVNAFDIHRTTHELCMRVYDGENFSIRLYDGELMKWSHPTQGSSGIVAPINNGVFFGWDNNIYATWDDGGSPGNGQICLTMAGDVVFSNLPAPVSARGIAMPPGKDFYYSTDGASGMKRMDKSNGAIIETISAAGAHGYGEISVQGGRLSKFATPSPRPLLPPDSFGAEQIGNPAPKDVKFVWKAVDGADGYDLYLRSLPATSFIKQNTTAISGASEEYTVEGLSAGDYQAYMVTIKDGQTSTQQFVLNFTVVAWPTNIRFTDFSKHKTYQHYNTPAGWNYRWGAITQLNADIEQDADLLGGKGMMHIPNETQRRLIEWTELDLIGDDVKDLEFETRFKMPILFTGIGPMIGLRCVPSGSTTSSINGVMAGFGDGNIMDVGTYSSGTWASLEFKPFGKVPNAWYRMKARIQGEDIKLKMWADVNEEPVDWDIEQTQTLIPDAGAAGFYVHDSKYILFDWVKVELL